VGSGFRTFTAGEVLTASNVQNYLMDQSVMVFGGSAARSSAIGTANFEEGMVSYLTDTDKVEAYNGTNWVSVAPTTSQGLTLINTTSFSGVSSQSVNDVFSTTYRNYRLVISVSGTTDNALGLRLRVSGSDNANADYNFQRLYAQSGTVGAVRQTAFTYIELGYFSNGVFGSQSVDMFNPFEARTTSGNVISNQFPNSNPNFDIYAFGTDVTTSYTGFTLIALAGNITGEVSVYGYNK